MTQQTGQEIITIHILPDISKSNANQNIKIGQLMEYNMRTIFFEKSFIKCDGEASTRSVSLPLDQQSELL